MRRLIAIVLAAALLAPGIADASWTFVNSGGNGTSASGTTLTFTIAGVHVGDSIAIGMKWEGGDTTITCSDTASTFVEPFVSAHLTDADAATHTACYTLSSATSGTVTYTVTWGAARTFRDIGGMAYTPSSSASIDGTPHLAVGNSTALNSGNTTTTGTDGVAFGTYGESGSAGTTAGAAINGVTRDQILTFGSGPRSNLWSKTYSAGFTGAATMTIGANPWGSAIMAFKTSGGAAAVGRQAILGSNIISGGGF